MQFEIGGVFYDTSCFQMHLFGPEAWDMLYRDPATGHVFIVVMNDNGVAIRPAHPAEIQTLAPADWRRPPAGQAAPPAEVPA